MLNAVWGMLIVISVISAIMTGRVAELNNALFDGTANAVKLIIALCGTICFWSGLMKIAEKSGISRAVSKALSPLLALIFHELDDESREAVSLNMSANLLGLSNAATPFGLKAMSCLQKQNSDKLTASDNMIIFVVINTASLQLIPTTIATVRAQAGSKNPMEIVTCVIISSIVSLAVGITLAKLLNKRKRLKP